MSLTIEINVPGLDIPFDFPLQSLVGQELTQLCVGVGQIQLHFYQPNIELQGKWLPGARIDIEAGFRLRRPSRSEFEVSAAGFGRNSGVLVELLGVRVVVAERCQSNELKVRFSNNWDLQLLTNPHGFESYHLHVEGQSVSVTKPW